MSPLSYLHDCCDTTFQIYTIDLDDTVSVLSSFKSTQSIAFAKSKKPVTMNLCASTVLCHESVNTKAHLVLSDEGENQISRMKTDYTSENAKLIGCV